VKALTNASLLSMRFRTKKLQSVHEQQTLYLTSSLDAFQISLASRRAARAIPKKEIRLTHTYFPCPLEEGERPLRFSIFSSLIMSRDLNLLRMRCVVFRVTGISGPNAVDT